MQEEPAKARRTISIRRSLIRNLSLLLAFLTGSILATTVVTGRRISEDTSQALIGRALGRMEAELSGFLGPVENGLRFAGRLAANGALDVTDARAMNRIFMPLIERIPQISSVNLADAEGRGYLLLRFPDRWRNRLTWTDRWGERLEFSEWRDPDTLIREWTVEQPDPEERYDPRTRAWWTVAQDAAREMEPAARIPGNVYWTPPYVFFTTGEPGITAMLHLEDAESHRWVLGFDVLLRDISEFTGRLAVSPNGFAIVIGRDRRVLGLPGLARFADPTARREMLLRLPAELGVPVIEDGVRTAQSLGDDAPPVFSFSSGGEMHWADVQTLPLGANESVSLVAVVPERDLVGVIHQQRLLLTGAAAVGFALALGMALYLARRYSRPLSRLATNSQRIGTLDLEHLDPVHSSLSEVEQLAAEQERMRIALDSFSRYVPVDVIRELMVRGEAARIGGTRRVLTSLFTDIRGFTSIAETLSPEALTAHIGVYFEEVMGIVQDDCRGTVTQLTGDGLVAFWGAPLQDDEHAAHAADAVLRCQERLAELDGQWRSAGLPPLPTRFGLATGPVVVGNVGSHSRLVYTALGDTVNLASRLEGLSRFYGTSALASAATREAAGAGFAWRLVDVVRVKGKARPEQVFELLGRTGQVSEPRLAFAAGYQEALGRYQARQFGEAIRRLETLDGARPDDPSVARLLDLSRHHQASPPAADWDGVSEFFEK